MTDTKSWSEQRLVCADGSAHPCRLTLSSGMPPDEILRLANDDLEPLCKGAPHRFQIRDVTAAEWSH